MREARAQKERKGSQGEAPGAAGESRGSRSGHVRQHTRETAAQDREVRGGGRQRFQGEHWQADRSLP